MKDPALKLPKEFWSLERAAGHGFEEVELTLLEEEICGDRKYIRYVDIEGNGWYETMIRQDKTWVTLEEAIFGKKKKKAGLSGRQIQDDMDPINDISLP